MKALSERREVRDVKRDYQDSRSGKIHQKRRIVYFVALFSALTFLPREALLHKDGDA